MLHSHIDVIVKPWLEGRERELGVFLNTEEAKGGDVVTWYCGTMLVGHTMKSKRQQDKTHVWGMACGGLVYDGRALSLLYDRTDVTFLASESLLPILSTNTLMNEYARVAGIGHMINGARVAGRQMLAYT